MAALSYNEAESSQISDDLDWKRRSADQSFPMRLQKFLARAGVASRRGSEALMSAGRVEVNGVVITELGFKVDPLLDSVSVDGVQVVWGAKPVTLILNKPAGIITSMKDYRGRRCVADIMPCDQYPGLYPIGRLDQDTTGLLLFSTDGNLGNALLHPSHHVDKTYVVQVKGSLGKHALDELERGVMLDDGMTSPAQARIIAQHTRTTELELVIHEGRKHQVKRMCLAVGHPVVHLHRSHFGPLSVEGLPEGLYRELTEEELVELYQAAGLELPS